MLSCASSDRASWARMLERRFIRCSPLIETTFCSFWYSPEMKYVAMSAPPFALAPISRRLPGCRIPDDSIGMFDTVESTATQVPAERANRLQLARRAPDAECPYER